MTKNISNLEASKLIKNGAKILDIRDAEDFNKSHIPGAININVNNLDNLRLDKFETIIVVCYSGVTSIAATEYLRELGYRNVFNLKNGYDNWKR